jgi:hypothetical protein
LGADSGDDGGAGEARQWKAKGESMKRISSKGSSGRYARIHLLNIRKLADKSHQRRLARLERRG